MEDLEKLLIKWKPLVDACKSYYIDCVPTGMSDAEFDALEIRAAQEDGFFARDYVYRTYLVGTKTKNSYIDKIKKTKVIGTTMLQAMRDLEESLGKSLYYDLKYDGSSLAIYLDPSTGIPKRIVTVGNLNLDNLGVDQTWKLINFLPRRFPLGIKAIQAEALIDTTRLGDSNPERARQKANGLINSKYCDSEVNNLLTIRAYRYFTDDSKFGVHLRSLDYREVLESFETIYSVIDGHPLFAPAQVWTLAELETATGFTETEMTVTDTGVFLNDGWVAYDGFGTCVKALKFEGAGASTEAIKTKVLGIQWNSQIPKGKDSWSANIIIEPVSVRGCIVKKPSAGSVGKMVKKSITPGAVVSIIMANSTIPMVGEVFSPGDGNFSWPTCPCGYHMSEVDVYSSLLKCGNPKCTDRLDRMRSYVWSLSNIASDLDLGKLLVIDRFKWADTDVDISQVLREVENNNDTGYYEYLESFMKTDLQKRNLDLVWKASFIILREVYEKSIRA